MRLDEKPTRPIRNGAYGITQDGYLIVLHRRNTALKGMAMRPALEYGRLVYRITVDGKTTSIRAFIVVRDVWGETMRDPGEHKEMCRKIDEHNRMIRAELKAQKKAERAHIDNRELPLCPYCRVRPLRNHALAETCGAQPCVHANRLVKERARKQRYREQRANPSQPRLWDKPLPGPWQHPMPCPWGDILFDTPPAYGVKWDSAEADPMTNRMEAGVYININQCEEVAA